MMKMRGVAKDIRTMGGAALIVGGILGWCYSLWPFPRQVSADIQELKNKDVEQDGEINELEDNLNEFVMEQRVAVGKQEEAAEVTKEVMLRLLDRIDRGE